MKKLLTAAAVLFICSALFAQTGRFSGGIGVGFQHNEIDLDLLNLEGKFNGFNAGMDINYDGGKNFITLMSMSLGMSDCTDFQSSYVNKDDMFTTLSVRIGEGYAFINNETFCLCPFVYGAGEFIDYQKKNVSFRTNSFVVGLGINAAYYFAENIGVNLNLRDGFTLISGVFYDNKNVSFKKQYYSYANGNTIEGSVGIILKI